MIKPDLKKINEIQDFIMHEEESQWELDDHIYRSYHRSFKISHIRFNAVRYLYICLYLVGKIDKIDWKDWDYDKMVVECKKHIEAPRYVKYSVNAKKILKAAGGMTSASLTYKIFDELLKNDLPETKEGWVPTDGHVVPYLGYFCFFKGVLSCLLRWIKSQKVPIGFIDTFEGVSHYFIDSIKWTKKESDEMYKYTKEKVDRENAKSRK